MALGTLSIDLVARLAQFEQDMGKAARATEASAARMASALGIVRTGLAGLGAGISVAGFTALAKATVNSLDRLNDLRDATGASIENLSALEDLAARTGTSFESVGTALVKFNGALNDAKPGSDAARALEALGLSVKELKSLDPAEALRRTAVALDGFADNGNKARLVQELFGKSLREVAPFLHDLATQGSLVAKVTAEQAAEAERFNQQLAGLQKNSQDAARAIAADLLPGLNKMLEVFTKLKAQGLLVDVVKDAAKGLVGLNNLTGNAGEDINRLIAKRTELERRLAAQQDLRRKTGYRGRDLVSENLEREKLELETLLEISRIRQKASIDTTTQYGDAVSRKFGRAKPSLPDTVKVDTEAEAAAKRLEEAYQSFIGSIREKVAAQQIEIQGGREATESDKLRIKFAEELGDKFKNLSASRQAEITAQINSLAIGEKELEQRKRLLAAVEAENTARQEIADAEVARSKSNEASVRAVTDYVFAIQAETDLIALQQSLAGKSEQQRAIAIEQYRIQLDLKKQLEAIDASQLDEAEREQQKNRARAAAAQAEANAATKVSDEFAKNLHDDVKGALSAAFRDTKDPLRAFGDAIANVVFTRVTNSLANALADQLVGVGGKGGLLGSVLGGSGGDSGAGLAGFFAGLFGSLPSKDGGGYTGNGSRSGGIDGMGGFLGILHPRETVIDHTKGQRAGNITVVHNNTFMVDVATKAMVQQAIAQSQRQAAETLNRNVDYGGRLARA